jgi:hypothetical protein
MNAGTGGNYRSLVARGLPVSNHRASLSFIFWIDEDPSISCGSQFTDAALQILPFNSCVYSSLLQLMHDEVCFDVVGRVKYGLHVCTHYVKKTGLCGAYGNLLTFSFCGTRSQQKPRLVNNFDEKARNYWSIVCLSAKTVPQAVETRHGHDCKKQHRLSTTESSQQSCDLQFLSATWNSHTRPPGNFGQALGQQRMLEMSS